MAYWTVAEARYWAYEASWEIHLATYESASDSEGDFLVTQEQKVDLLDAADSDVQRSTRLAAMAQSDLDDEIVNLDALQATLVAAEEAHAVQVYLAAQADAAALVQADIITAWSNVDGCTTGEEGCFNALDNLETLYTNA
jgi:hypothetical protein